MRLPVVAIRAPALLLDAAASIVFVRRFGPAEMGRYSIVLVCGMAAFLVLDRGRLGLGQLAIGPRTPWRMYQALVQRRKVNAARLLLLAGLVALVAPDATILYLPLVVTAGLTLELRWAQLAVGASRLLLGSFFLRPVLLIAVASLQPGGVPHPAIGLVVGTLFAAAGVMQLDRRVAAASLPSDLDRDEAASNDALEKRAAHATRGRWTVGLASLVAQMYASGDIVVVAVLVGETQAGVYALGYKPIAALLILIGFQRELWLARLSTDKVLPSPIRVWGVANALALCLALLALLAKPLELLTGVEGADTVCALLVLSAPAILVGSLLYARLLSAGEGRGFIYATGSCLLFSICMNLLLVPWGGAKGAAVTTVLTELLLTCLLWQRSRWRSLSLDGPAYGGE